MRSPVHNQINIYLQPNQTADQTTGQKLYQLLRCIEFERVFFRARKANPLVFLMYGLFSSFIIFFLQTIVTYQSIKKRMVTEKYFFLTIKKAMTKTRPFVM